MNNLFNGDNNYTFKGVESDYLDIVEAAEAAIAKGMQVELTWVETVPTETRLKQIDHQIQESRRHQVGQRELFLVINRLEEFAAAVHDRLDTVDFVTKREIIRGLVKRVEIHKDEILVVFWVNPDPGFNASERSTGSDAREKSMQDRTRRNLARNREHDVGRT